MQSLLESGQIISSISLPLCPYCCMSQWSGRYVIWDCPCHQTDWIWKFDSHGEHKEHQSSTYKAFYTSLSCEIFLTKPWLHLLLSFEYAPKEQSFFAICSSSNSSLWLNSLSVSSALILCWKLQMTSFPAASSSQQYARFNAWFRHPFLHPSWRAYQQSLHGSQLFFEVSNLCHHNWHDDNVRAFSFGMWGIWSLWRCQRGIASWLSIIFKAEGLESRVGVGLEFIHPTWNCLRHIEANNRFLLQSVWSDLVYSIRRLELRFFYLTWL